VFRSGSSVLDVCFVGDIKDIFTMKPDNLRAIVYGNGMTVRFSFCILFPGNLSDAVFPL